MNSSAHEIPPFYGNVGKALWMMSYPEPYDQLLKESFGDHWDNFTLPDLVRAIREAPSVDDTGYARWPNELEERVFAIFAAASTPDGGGLPAVRDAIAPLLQSRYFHERWAAALGLGWQQDERAVPVLSHMLTEYFPPDLRYLAPNLPELRIERWRNQIPRIFTLAWRRSAFVPVLRDGLEQVLRLLASDPAELQHMTQVVHDAVRDSWNLFAETTIFALGRLEAYDALDGLSIPPARLQSWRVHLIMGALHDRYPQLHIGTWNQRPGLYEDVNRFLTSQFGLAADAREEALDQYERSYLTHNYRHIPSAWVEDWR